MTPGRKALLWQLATLGGGGILLVWLGRRFPLLEYLNQAQQQIAGMGFWGAIYYPLLYALCNVLLLPGGTLAMGSGLFFGLWWGTLLNVIGSTLGAAISFALSRWTFRRWVRQRLLRHPRGGVLDEAVTREGWKIVFLSQLHPLAPSSLLNYLYGVTRIPFGTCLLWVALGQTPGAFLYAYLGTLAQLGLRLARGDSHPRSVEYVLWIGGLVATVGLTYLLGRIARKVLTQAEVQAAGFSCSKDADPASTSPSCPSDAGDCRR